ncbi:MAG TPA: serine hydrolase [Gemmatimonadaceae bacterium]|nr:serine hydrolase [Gemmatimonadaceae bacterium]
MATKALIAAIAACVALPAVGAQSNGKATNVDWRAFDKYVEQAARDWHVPALAIAVVKDDSLVFAKGYGVIEIGKPTRADEHTRFAIGSTTKAMTSVSLGMLVDEGKLHWDDRVIDYLPDFRLYDPYATRELTVRDLLTHRSGLGSTDLLWAGPWTYTMPEMIRRLRYVKPASSFRSEWEYQNVVYAIGGTLIERVSGMPWETFVRTRIFAPLGMNETEPLVSLIKGKPNVAVPHVERNDTVRVVPIRSTDAIAPAGSVWSSVSDMSKWMRFILDSGRVGSQRLLKPETFRELIAPQIRAPIDEYPALRLAKPDFFSYGLGWFVQDYRGQAVWMHTGSIDGMCAIIGLIPEKRIGVYVLENLDHAELRHGLMYSVFDLYSGGPSRDWSHELHDLFASLARSRPQAQPGMRAETHPSLPLEKYAGTYVDSTYGTVQVTLANGALQVQLADQAPQKLEPVEYETFRSPASPGVRQTLALTFVPDGAGNVSAVRLFGVPFERVRPARR